MTDRATFRISFFAPLMAMLLALGLASAPANAKDRSLVRKQSAHSVETTIDRLAAIVEERGAKVFARIDHAAGAASIEAELRPTTALIFGNPKLGTPLIQSAQTAGLDLPIRMVAYEDADGRVWLVYRRIGAVAKAHGVKGQAKAQAAIDKAMEGLSAAATSTN